MLTPAQEEWLAHLPNDDFIEIFPYNPSSPRYFEHIKHKILSRLPYSEVVHKGASSLGISGQGELDIYIPVTPSEFNSYLEPLISLFGQPQSHYPVERARFVDRVENTKAEIFLINKEGDGWIRSEKFEANLKKNPAALKEYRILKEQGKGLSTRAYYRRKIGFINEILNGNLN